MGCGLAVFDGVRPPHHGGAWRAAEFGQLAYRSQSCRRMRWAHVVRLM